MTRSIIPFVLAIVLGTWQIGCIAVGLPPSRTDLGSQIHVVNGQTVKSTRISSGVHSASIARTRKIDFDIGAGFIYEHADQTDGYEEPTPPDDSVAPVESRFGGYLEFAKRIATTKITRTWLGAHAEVTRGSDTALYSASLTGRLSWEVYMAGSSNSVSVGPNGYSTALVRGALGIGTYVESGVRRNGYGNAEFLVSAGLSMRLPGFLVFGFSNR